MKLNFKNVLFLVGIFVMAFGFFGISNADAANTLSSSTYRDTNLDGTVDTVVWVMDEDPLLCPYEAGDWAVTVAGDIGITAITGVTCATLNEIAIAVTASPKVTGGAVAPTITYTAAAGTADSVTLVSGNMTNKSGSPTDLAKPQIKTITYRDANTNGFMDAVDVGYTEAVQSGSTLGANDLLFTSVGGFTNAAFGALATDLITVNGVTATTVPLGTPTTVSGTVNPSGTITVSSQNLFSLLDSAGNNNTTLGAQAGNASIVDGIAPLLLSAARTTINTIALTFSEMMDVDSLIGAGWYVAGATVTANTDPADGSATMILTTTGQTSTAGTADVTYVFIEGGTEDASGNNLGDVSVAVEAVDQVRPTVVITLSDYNLDVGQTSLVTFTFSEDPTGFAAADVTSPNGTLGAIDASTVTAQTATFTPTADVTVFTNVITVGTSWTDSSAATMAPLSTTDSANYVVATESSGGGGGGGSRAKKATPAVPAKVTPPADCLTGMQFSPSTGKNCNSATPATPNAQGNAFGTLTVKMGSKGEACRAWQSFFNAKGSKLVVDGWCGKLTIEAAKAWQTQNGLVSDGLLGPASRAKALAQ